MTHGAGPDFPAAPKKEREAQLRVDISADEGELNSHQENLEGLDRKAKLMEDVLAIDGIRRAAEQRGEKWARAGDIHPDVSPDLLERARWLAEEYRQLATDALETVAEKIVEGGERMYHEVLARYAQAAQDGNSANLGLLHQILHFEHLAHAHDPGTFHPVPWDHVESMARFSQGATSHPDPSQRRAHLAAAAQHPAFRHHHRLIDLHANHFS